jgi:hypothetical protein
MMTVGTGDGQKRAPIEPAQTNTQYTPPRLIGSLFSFPATVFCRQAGCAWPISSGDGGRFIGEEHTLLDVFALGDPPQRAGAIETAKDAGTAVPAKRSGLIAFIRLTV